MQVRCVKAFGTTAAGEVVEVPDGAAVDPEHWEVLADPPEDPPETPAAGDGAAGQLGAAEETLAQLAAKGGK